MERKRLLSILTTVALTVSVPSAASAQLLGGDSTDPVTGVTETVTEDDGGDDTSTDDTSGDDPISDSLKLVDDTVDSGTEVLSGGEEPSDDDPVGTVTKTVDDATADPVGTVEKTVKTVTDTVGDVLAGGGDPPSGDPPGDDDGDEDGSDQDGSDHVRAASNPDAGPETSSSGPVVRPPAPAPGMLEGMDRGGSGLPDLPRVDSVGSLVDDTGNVMHDGMLADPGGTEEQTVVAAPLGGEHTPGEATRTLLSIFALLLVGGAMITWKLTWDRVQEWNG